jgi:hypothetical protein
MYGLFPDLSTLSGILRGLQVAREPDILQGGTPPALSLMHISRAMRKAISSAERDADGNTGDDTDIGMLFDTGDIGALLLQQVALPLHRLYARAVCKVWRAEVDALVDGWQQRLSDELLVKCIPSTDFRAAGLSFCHPPSGSALDVCGEKKPSNNCQFRFWHDGQRVKGQCVLAVSSSCINGSVVTVEGATHVAWTVIEQQKLENSPSVGVIDGFPRIPGDAPQGKWHAHSNLWPVDVWPPGGMPFLNVFRGHTHRVNATELNHRRMIRITSHGLEWDGLIQTDENR